MCACGHSMKDHDRPAGEREPYGECHATTTRLVGDRDGFALGHTVIGPCPCREGWKVEDDE